MKDEKEQRYNLPWVQEHIEGFEIKTVRSYFSKIVHLLGRGEDEFKDSRGQIWFDKELADFLVWIFRHIDEAFLSKSLNQSQDIAPQEALQFQQALLAYVETLEEPSKSEFRALSESLAMDRSQALFEKTLENAKELQVLFQQILASDRIELLERLNLAMEAWKEDLEMRVEKIK